MIIGLDVGYAFTKDNSGHIFRSAYSLSDRSVAGSVSLRIGEKTYYPGNGIMTSSVDKTDGIVNHVCTVYDIIQNNAHDVQLCVGLPIAQYKRQKAKLKETIMSYNKTPVWSNGVAYSVCIKDVCVVMQGVAGLYTLDSLDGDYLVIDIGGYTIDTCLVEYGPGKSEIKTSDTWYKGIRTLYSDVVSMVNNHYGVALDNSYGDRILRGKLTINGKPAELSFVVPYLVGYVDQICDEIRLRYPVETADIYLTGGGASLMSAAFEKRLGKVNVLQEPQFANAKGYYIIGRHKFGGR